MKKMLRTLLFASACLTMSAPAFAQDSECSTDADCSSGYTCEEVGAYACPAIACEEGDTECEMRAAELDEECGGGGGTIMGCVPPPPEQCDPEAGAMACGDGLLCVTYTFESCSGGEPEPVMGGGSTGSTGGGEDMGSDGGGEGDDEDGTDHGPDHGEPHECMTEQESYCVPPYLAPCEQDADCGGGFTCEQQVICQSCPVEVTCSVDEMGNETCEESGEPACESSCEPAGPKYCELVEVECQSDADCAGGMICETFEQGYDTPPCAPPSEDGSEPNCAEPEPAEEVSYCLPADWERWGGGGRGYEEDYGTDGGSAYGESVTNAGDREEGDGWNIVDAQVAQDGDASGSDDGSAEDAGGCQSAGNAGGTGLGLLAALGMMLGLRRRKNS